MNDNSNNTVINLRMTEQTHIGEIRKTQPARMTNNLNNMRYTAVIGGMVSAASQMDIDTIQWMTDGANALLATGQSCFMVALNVRHCPERVVMHERRTWFCWFLYP